MCVYNSRDTILNAKGAEDSRGQGVETSVTGKIQFHKGCVPEQVKKAGLF